VRLPRGLRDYALTDEGGRGRLMALRYLLSLLALTGVCAVVTAFKGGATWSDFDSFLQSWLPVISGLLGLTIAFYCTKSDA
jgi:hypothetical protein